MLDLATKNSSTHVDGGPQSLCPRACEPGHSPPSNTKYRWRGGEREGSIIFVINLTSFINQGLQQISKPQDNHFLENGKGVKDFCTTDIFTIYLDISTLCLLCKKLQALKQCLRTEENKLRTIWRKTTSFHFITTNKYENHKIKTDFSNSVLKVLLFQDVLNFN